MNKVQNNKAWWLVLPVFLLVAFSAVIPMMTVVNYSVQDIFGPYQRVFVGGEWFRDTLRDEELRGAFFRNLLFSLEVLALEIPLGVAVALALPAKGWRASLSLVLVALPLLIPWNVVGTIWQIFGRADIGLVARTGAALTRGAAGTGAAGRAVGLAAVAPALVAAAGFVAIADDGHLVAGGVHRPGLQRDAAPPLVLVDDGHQHRHRAGRLVERGHEATSSSSSDSCSAESSSR